MSSICIVDYGVGNIFSAMKGLKRFEPDVILSEDPAEVRAAKALVLPGQGAFRSGMEGLKIRGLLPEVRRAAEEGKPVLGICLGAQLLLTKGYEFGEWEGLGFLEGNVAHFPALADGAKVPHMGWNSVEPPIGKTWDGTMLQGVPPGTDMYFIHSYILRPAERSAVLAETTYGGLRFASAIARGNIVGCQFHPEKSGEAGLMILRNFAAMCR